MPETSNKVPEVTLVFWIIKIAATTLGGVKNESPRFREFVAVNPGASVRLVSARLGIAELFGSARLTAISASPPPGATPRFVEFPVLLTQPPPLSPKIRNCLVALRI